MEADDLLCSRNARSRTPLVGRAQLGSSHPSLMRTTMIYTYVLNRGPAGFVVRWMDFEPPYGGAVMRIRIRCWANY